MTAFDELMAFQRETEALGQIAGRLGWDQETVMPRGATEQRSEEMAALESVLHARRTDPRLGTGSLQPNPPMPPQRPSSARSGGATSATPRSPAPLPRKSPG